MRITLLVKCSDCGGTFQSQRPLPLVVETMSCGGCEEVGTSLIMEIRVGREPKKVV